MNVYAKFRSFPLRINKALGIFRKLVTTRRTRTTVVALRDPSGSKNTSNWPQPNGDILKKDKTE